MKYNMLERYKGLIVYATYYKSEKQIPTIWNAII